LEKFFNKWPGLPFERKNAISLIKKSELQKVLQTANVKEEKWAEVGKAQTQKEPKSNTKHFNTCFVYTVFLHVCNYALTVNIHLTVLYNNILN